jgi:electron transfer flavoprotein beta subunit
MKIVVCIKQVPGTTEVKIDAETHTLIREGSEAIINPFDLYALEEGIRLKEKYGGTVRSLPWGLHRQRKLCGGVKLRADEAVLVTDRALPVLTRGLHQLRWPRPSGL